MKKLLFVAVAFTFWFLLQPCHSLKVFHFYLVTSLAARALVAMALRLGWIRFHSMWDGAQTVVNPRFTFDSGGAGVSSLSHRWPLRGLWLGVAEKLNVSERCGINVEAWWLIPSTAARDGRVSSWHYNIYPGNWYRSGCLYYDSRSSKH